MAKKKVVNRRKRTGRKRGTGETPRNSFGSLPSGLVLARSCSFTTSPSFAPFSFFLPLPTIVLSSLSNKLRVSAMFFHRCACTYRLVCVQATFACSGREREQERKREGPQVLKGKGGNAKKKIKKGTRCENNAIGANRFLDA